MDMLTLLKQRGPDTAAALYADFCGYLYPYRWRIAGVATMTAIAPLLATAVLSLVQTMIDDVLVAQNLAMLPWVAGAYMAAVALKVGLDHVGSRMDAFVSEGIVTDVRRDVFRQLMSLSPGSNTRIGTGDQMSRISDDTDYVERLTLSAPMTLFGDIIAVVVFATFVIMIDWQLTLLALLVAPAFAAISMNYAPLMRRVERISRETTSRWFDALEERAGARPMIYVYDRGKHEARAFADKIGTAREVELKNARVDAWYDSLIEMTTAVGGLAVLSFGAWQIASGALTVGALVAFMGAIGALYSPIRSLARAVTRFQKAAAGAQRVAQLLAIESRVKERPGAEAIKVVRGGIEFRNVTFGYPGRQPVLRNVNFEIAPGERVAIAGASGAGKSTLLALLSRMHDPDAGAILIDGYDIRDLTLSALRTAIAVVFQEPYLLHGTVADNVAYAEPDATPKEIAEAGDRARLTEMVEELELGYATGIGPRGEDLSGGQRQRIALARALLKKSPILILDEATAAVDSETEEAIQEAIDDLPLEQTVLIVAHRLSSLKRADRVIVMENGEVVETGKPRDLLASQSRYRKLFAGQLSASEGAEG